MPTPTPTLSPEFQKIAASYAADPGAAMQGGLILALAAFFIILCTIYTIFLCCTRYKTWSRKLPPGEAKKRIERILDTLE